MRTLYINTPPPFIKLVLSPLWFLKFKDGSINVENFKMMMYVYGRGRINVVMYVYKGGFLKYGVCL